MTLELTDLTAYLLVFVRMTGMIALNPVFARRNVPALVRTALIFCLTLVLTPVVGISLTADLDTLTLVLVMLRELFIGAVCAMVFLIFYYLLFFAGDIMDMQFGLSMARVFDPGTNIQTSITGNLFNVLFMLYFFLTNSHLVMLQAFTSSYQLVPVGAAAITGDVGSFMVTLFASAFSLALRLALPFIAAEFVIEVSMGILMKLIPQIHVFVINFQLKIMMGILMLFLFCQPIANFIDNYMDAMLQSLGRALTILGG